MLLKVALLIGLTSLFLGSAMYGESKGRVWWIFTDTIIYLVLSIFIIMNT